MSTASLQWFEIKILDYKNADKRIKTFVSPGTSTLVVGGEYGATHVPPKNKAKIDNRMRVPVKVLFWRAKDGKRAKRIGERLGTVISCHKVDTSFHYKKIEYLDLKQAPPTVTIANEDEFILNSQGELTPSAKATRAELERKYEIEIDY